MQKRLLISLLYMAIMIASFVDAGEVDANSDTLVVVMNSKNSVTYTKKQVRNIFLGQGDRSIKPVVPSPNSKSRAIFNTQVIGLKESRIQSYFAQMRFSGRARPPQQKASNEELIEFVLRTPNSITYVPKGTKIPDDLIVVYEVL